MMKLLKFLSKINMKYSKLMVMLLILSNVILATEYEQILSEIKKVQAENIKIRDFFRRDEGDLELAGKLDTSSEPLGRSFIDNSRIYSYDSPDYLSMQIHSRYKPCDIDKFISDTLAEGGTKMEGLESVLYMEDKIYNVEAKKGLREYKKFIKIYKKISETAYKKRLEEYKEFKKSLD